MEDELKNFSNERIDSFLTEVGGKFDLDRILFNEQKKEIKLTTNQKLEDWDEIKKILDGLNFEKDELFLNIRFSKFLDEVKKRLKK